MNQNTYQKESEKDTKHFQTNIQTRTSTWIKKDPQMDPNITQVLEKWDPNFWTSFLFNFESILDLNFEVDFVPYFGPKLVPKPHKMRVPHQQISEDRFLMA